MTPEISELVRELRAYGRKYGTPEVCIQAADALERISERTAHGWQPIATAPRDGTQVLLWAEAWEMTWGIQIGSYLPHEDCWHTSEGTVDDNGPDFDPEADVDDDFDFDENAGPTHWMKLPAIPASVSGSTDGRNG